MKRLVIIGLLLLLCLTPAVLPVLAEDDSQTSTDCACECCPVCGGYPLDCPEPPQGQCTGPCTCGQDGGTNGDDTGWDQPDI